MGEEIEGQQTNTSEEEEELFRATSEKWLSSGISFSYHLSIIYQ